MTLELLVAIGAVFVGVAVTTGLVAARLLGDPSPERQRLRRVIAAQAGGGGLLIDSEQLADIRPSAEWEQLARLVPKSPKEMSRLRKRLLRAGYDDFGAAVVFGLLEVALPVVFAITAFLLLPNPRNVIGAVIGGAIGYFAPGLWLERRIDARQRKIRQGLPDALDLLVVCLEAGSSLDQAILKTGGELGVAYPELARELMTVITETRAGKPRLEALQSFADRTRMDEVRALTAMLVQTDRFGTSVSQALRAHADSVRTLRRQVAEERAAKVGVKLVFPLVFFLFPALYVIILGAAMLELARVFSR